ncbi:Translin-1 [Teratosphaeriaceae sp. CCFEE 6253]|nr:Translin-1 [Teratosphaeriaceae sp. CCFEE 6253]
MADGMIQSGIFESLQRKIDDDSAVKDALRDIVQELEKQGLKSHPDFDMCWLTGIQIVQRNRYSQEHTLPAPQTPRRIYAEALPVPSVVNAAQANIDKEVQTIHKLSETASKQPYYKFNYSWARQVQDACFSILLCGWLGGFGKGDVGQLLTIEEVGGIADVPVNLKDRDAFHITIEEYLQSLISLVDELARLARNSVTLGDYRRPQLIAQFIKDVHAGFQILNLKNDTLRKRSDGIKYRVKEVEDVVYDLSLRGLLPKK